MIRQEMARLQGVGGIIGDLLQLNPAYQAGRYVGTKLTSGSTQPPPQGTVPGPDTQGGAPPGGGEMDTTTKVLIGAGVLATGIVIYAVATAKKRR